VSRHPAQKASTVKNCEEYVNNSLSAHFKLIHKHGQQLKADRENLSTDKWKDLALTTNRKLSNGIASPRKIISQVRPKNSTRERTQAIKSISRNSNLIDKTNNSDFTDLKTERNSRMITTLGE